MQWAGTIFRHLFPIDGPALVEGRLLSMLFGLVIPVQRSVTHHYEVKVRSSDYVLCLNLDFAAIIDLPPAHARRGKPVRFVDAGNNLSKFPFTIRPFKHERIINWRARDLVMASDGEIVTLWPFWDGRNTGWFVYPDPSQGDVNISDYPPRHPVLGAAWWDTDSKQLFIWNGREWVPASCCDGGIEVGEKPPVKPLKGWLFWSTKDGQLYIWTGHQWVAASCCSNAGTGVSIGSTLPANPIAGQLFWSSNDGQLYVWTGSQWVAASCCEGAGGIGDAPNTGVIYGRQNGAWTSLLDDGQFL